MELQLQYPAPEDDNPLDLMPRWLEEMFAQKAKLDSDIYAGAVLAHYFCGNYDCLATGYDPEEKILFGFASFFGLQAPEAEYGSVFLSELENLRLPPLQTRVERETWSFRENLTVEEWRKLKS